MLNDIGKHTLKIQGMRMELQFLWLRVLTLNGIIEYDFSFQMRDDRLFEMIYDRDDFLYDMLYDIRFKASPVSIGRSQDRNGCADAGEAPVKQGIRSL